MESEVEVRKCITLKLPIIMKKTDNYDEENCDSIAFHLIVKFPGPAFPVLFSFLKIMSASLSTVQTIF